ncbi:MAG: LysR family transcriptional regulator [Paracoccaceae bacterium]|jgi:DNA-binding transcriptional LysR family regulator|nr:LysR family transcriptional regulator [Paracoccaceae bacterium]MDP7184983.1 LysR family transcriptional regulator [Paracoccaceae bacterium]
MSRSRRHIPPNGWLMAFEAVARLGSVTAAARELDLTQGAVSRQLKKLEALLGVELLRRSGRQVVPTPQGAQYAEQVRGALSQISNATIALQANPEGGALNLAILPAFGAHWLAPRLPEFLRQHPGITMNMATRIEPFDFAAEDFHGAIHHGTADWPNAGALKLWDEEVVPVMAPDLYEKGMGAADIAALPRMQLQTRRSVWGQWLAAHGVEAGEAPVMVVDQFATMHKAVQAGLGVGLMPTYLVGADLAEGRLVSLAGTQPVHDGAYYLVWPEGGSDYPPLVAFREWLRDESIGP